MPTDRAWTQRQPGSDQDEQLQVNAGPGTHQTDGPGSQVQEAPQQVQSSQSMDLTEENLRGQRSKVKQEVWKPGGGHQRQEEEVEVEEEPGPQERDLWRSRWPSHHCRTEA